MNKEELKNRLTCALLHDLHACDTCKKCGPDAMSARINLVEAIKEYLATSETTDWLEPIGIKPVHGWEN